MSKDNGGRTRLPALLAEGVEQAGEEAREARRELLHLLTGTAAPSGVGLALDEMSRTATFKARVQRSGRVSIPDAEREALDIREGDIVQTIVVPVKQERGDDNE